MKKYFITSDIHGYFDIFYKKLIEIGFDEQNPDHILVICGDIFDRGNQPLEVYNFLKGLPRERRVLIRGNHEFLLQQLVDREYALSHDLHNRTYDTLFSIAGMSRSEEEFKKWAGMPAQISEYDEWAQKQQEKWQKIEHKIFHNRKIKEILKWMASDEWVNYYRIGNYVLVHAFVPLKTEFDPDQGFNCLKIDPDWDNRMVLPQAKNALHDFYWEQATWENPWQCYLDHKDEPFFKQNILICGHWHASDFWNNLEFGENDQKFNTYTHNPIYISEKNPGIIALDACTAATKGVNFLIINEDLTYEVHNHF